MIIGIFASTIFVTSNVNAAILKDRQQALAKKADRVTIGKIAYKDIKLSLTRQATQTNKQTQSTKAQMLALKQKALLPE